MASNSSSSSQQKNQFFILCIIVIIIVIMGFGITAYILNMKKKAKNYKPCPPPPAKAPNVSSVDPIAEDMIMISSLLYFTPIGPLPPNWVLIAPPFYSALEKGYALTICKNTKTQAYAVGIRGSVMITTPAGFIDWFNDLDVLKMVDAPAPYPGHCSKGAWNGYKAIIDTIPNFNTYIPAGSTVYVTGHSLGGSLVPLVALRIADQVPNSNVIPISFAAPSTFDQTLATYFDSKLGSTSQRYWNTEDFVPYAWSNLNNPPSYIDNFSKDPFLKSIFNIYQTVVNGELCYVQVQGSKPMNGTYLLPVSPTALPQKIGYMHAHNTYYVMIKNLLKKN